MHFKYLLIWLLDQPAPSDTRPARPVGYQISPAESDTRSARPSRILDQSGPVGY